MTYSLFHKEMIQLYNPSSFAVLEQTKWVFLVVVQYWGGHSFYCSS